LLALGGKDADIKKMGTIPFSPFIKIERDYPLFRRIFKVSADFMNNSSELTLDENSYIITIHFKKRGKTMISIRLMRLGAKKKPFYRIIAIDSSKPRESKAKDILGYYDPLKEPPEIKVDYERANYWLKRGAQASKTVQSLLNKVSKQEKLSKQHSKT